MERDLRHRLLRTNFNSLYLCGLAWFSCTVLCRMIGSAASPGRNRHERQNIGGPRRLCRSCEVVSKDLRDVSGSRGSRLGEKPALYANVSVFCSLLRLRNKAEQDLQILVDLSAWPCAP